MSDQPDISPPERAAGAPKPKRRRRVLVWSMIVVASVLLVFSITANWVQRAVLDTDQVVDTSDEILSDQDVQEALSIYLVDQVYASVDVQGEIEAKLPRSQGAVRSGGGGDQADRAERLGEGARLAAGAGPRLVAIRRSHGQFVRLIEDKGEYVATTGGAVTLEYGDVVADLATRLGVDPATISKVQSLVQEVSKDLKQRLTTIQDRIKTVRADLAQVEAGTLSPQQEQDLETLQTNLVELQGKIASLDKKIASTQAKAPAQLQDSLAKLDGRLSELDGRLTAVEDAPPRCSRIPNRRTSMGWTPRSPWPRLGSPTLLDRQAAPEPRRARRAEVRPTRRSPDPRGGAPQPRLRAAAAGAVPVRGRDLPGAGWRRRALIAAGGGILTATLLVLLTRRLLGGAVVDSVAGSETVKPAIQSVYDIVSGTLRERALFALVIGVAFVAAGMLAGPGRHEVAVRRALAPYLRDQPAAVYLVVAVLFLLWLTIMPGINNLGQVLVIVLLAALAVVGIEVLRRQTAQEFPPHPNGP